MVMKPMVKCLTKTSIHIVVFTFPIKSYITNQRISRQICSFHKLINTCLLLLLLSFFVPLIGSQNIFRMSAATFAAAVTGPVYMGLNPNGSKLFQTTNSVPWSRKTVSNGCRVHCMKVWNPIDNKKFETLSYLPPLTDDSIAKEVDYMMRKGWIPCLEFDSVGYVYRENSRIPNYYDGRYWTLWKLPMFGCTDASQVLNEIQECKAAYPNAYIRCLAFDNVRQAQCMSFVIQKPTAP